MFVFLLISPLYAEDVVIHSSSTFVACQSIGDTNVFLTDPNNLATLKPGYIYMPNGCGSLPPVAWKYLKIQSGAVVEMAAAEKSAVDAQTLANFDLMVRTSSKKKIDGFEDTPLLLRALADIIKDEINIVRAWTVSFKAEVAAATTLADLKARVATLPTLNARNLAQLKTEIKTRIDSGTIDEK